MNKDGKVVAVINDKTILAHFEDSDLPKQAGLGAKCLVFAEIETPELTDTVGVTKVQMPKGFVELRLVQADPHLVLLGEYREERERVVRQANPLLRALMPSSLAPTEEVVVEHKSHPMTVRSSESLGIRAGPIGVGDYVAIVRE